MIVLNTMSMSGDTAKSLRRSRRLAGLPPEYLDLSVPTPFIDMKEDVATMSFTEKVLGAMMMTGAIVFMTLWK